MDFSVVEKSSKLTISVCGMYSVSYALCVPEFLDRVEPVLYTSLGLKKNVNYGKCKNHNFSP
jgi:hypothetical protein